MSLSSTGFHGNAQLSLPKCSQYSRNVLDEATALDNICLFHLVSAGPEGRTMCCMRFVHRAPIHVTSVFLF